MSPTKLFTIPAVALSLFAASAGNARADCGMGEVDWYASENMAVSRADDLLHHGKPQEAARELLAMWPRMREAKPVASSVPAIASGVRLMALATVRSGGDVRSTLGWSSTTQAAREQNIAWAVSRLRMLAAIAPSDNVARTDLGEALSRSHETRQEGAAILEELDALNRVASAEGYAALALIRSEAADPRGAELAQGECLHWAFDTDAQCVVHGTLAAELTAAR